MRKIVLLTVICLLTSVAIQGQTIKQQGVTYRYNGKQQRTPLGNVTISYDANTRTVLSNEQNGTFTLLLEGRRMGDRIGLVTVKKREMMVFNQHAVDEWSIRKEPLMLILCNADEFERQKENLINIGKREARKKYDRQKAELEAKLSASQMKQQEYEAALDKAYEELERFQKNVGEYADLFARIDESEVDTLAQRALDLFNQGEVNEAIRLFEQGHYMEKLDKALKNSQQADQLKAVAEQAKAQATQDSLKALQSLKAQIEAYKLNNEWSKAGELLKGLADRLNTVYDCFCYGEFCSKQHNFKEAEVYIRRAMSILEKQEDKESLVYLYTQSSLVLVLANLYAITQRFTESETMFKEALDISRRLALSTPQAYETYVATTLIGLASLYSITQRFTESGTMYKEALGTYRRLAQLNPQIYESYVAGALYCLADLYFHSQQFTESETMFKEALEVYRRLTKSNPQEHEPNMATTLNGLAKLYSVTQRFTESETMYKEALEIRRRLAQSNPQVFESYVATTLNGLANLYRKTRQFTESETMYKEALRTYHRLEQSNTQVYEPDVAATLTELADLYCQSQQLTECETMYKEALKSTRRLVSANPKVFEPYLAERLNRLAIFYGFTERYVESDTIFKEALDIYKRLSSANPKIYQPIMSMLLYSLGINKMATKQFADAIAPFEEAVEIFRRYADFHPEQKQYYENSLNYLSLLYIEVKKYISAFRIYKELLPIMRKQYEITPEHIRSNYANCLNNQSCCGIFVMQYVEAEQFAREGLAVDSTNHILYANLAAALLFQGKYDEAEQIYRQYKYEMKDGILDDFKQYAEAGVIPKEREADVERIKRMLEE